MKKFLSTLFLVSCVIVLRAQTFNVSGRVVNEKDNAPLQGASVFINNGSKGTLTDAEGRFSLTGISYSSFELVVSFVSYETIVIKVDPENISKNFLVKMSPRTNELQEVIVGGIIPDGWKKWGAMFTKQFIGTSAIAQRCVFQNPEALRFRQNKKTGVVTVTASDKLIIKNNKLGYNINYQLEDFMYDGAKGMVYFTGYAYFDTMPSRRRRQEDNWKEERKKAYLGSMMHFMRSFYLNTVTDEGFELTQLIRLNKKDSVTRPFYDRIMMGNLSDVDTSKFNIQIVKNSMFSAPVIHVIGKKRLPVDSIRLIDSVNKRVLLYFANDIQLLYKNELESPEYVSEQLPVRTRRFPETSIFYLVKRQAVVVEKNGLYYDPLNLFTAGYWAFEKLAELLPSDYVLGE